jgi:hypothetical protein
LVQAVVRRSRAARILVWLWVPLQCIGAAAEQKAPSDGVSSTAGSVIRVNTASALAVAVDRLTSGTTIVIAPGRYRLTRPLAIANVHDVTIRGESGAARDVVLEGPGLHSDRGDQLPDAIWTGKVSRLRLADFTVTAYPRHCVIMNAGTVAPTIHNVHFVDCGQQALKANPDPAGLGVVNGIVEHSQFEYRTTSRDSYTNAISAIGAVGWVIRHNLFRNIKAPVGQMAGPTLLFRGGARDTVVEGNTFLNCQRGVSFGMVDRTPDDHTGGVIRNNFFVRDRGEPGDVAVSLWDAPGAHVVHNTFILQGTFRASIDYRWPDTTGVIVANNLLDAPPWKRDDATAVEIGNVVDAGPDWFVHAADGDLHLTERATRAIDRALAIPGVRTESDWDGEPRPFGARADVGADERRASNR